MRHFLRIAQNENVVPIMGELMRKPQLWDTDNFRKEFPGSALTQVNDILIRYPNTTKSDDYFSVGGIDNIVWQPAAKELPALRGVILRLMSAVGAYNLGRVMVSKLAPGAVIAPHIDQGTDYTAQSDIVRYHVCLQGTPGSLFICGGETVQMLTGEVWWFAADVLHECRNNSASERIHIVVDLNVWGRE